MTTAYPSLSLDGFVTNSERKADYIFSSFFAADYSMSNLYNGNISSFQYLLAIYGSDINQLFIEIENTLSNLFSRYYTNVLVNVIEETNIKGTSDIGIIISLEYTDELGKTFSLGKLLETADSKLVSMVDLINNG